MFIVVQGTYPCRQLILSQGGERQQQTNTLSRWTHGFFHKHQCTSLCCALRFYRCILSLGIKHQRIPCANNQHQRGCAHPPAPTICLQQWRSWSNSNQRWPFWNEPLLTYSFRRAMSPPRRPEASESPVRGQRGVYRNSPRRPRPEDEETGYMSVATAPLSPSPTGYEGAHSDPLVPLSPATSHKQLAPAGQSHTPGGYVYSDS